MSCGYHLLIAPQSPVDGPPSDATGVFRFVGFLNAHVSGADVPRASTGWIGPFDSYKRQDVCMANNLREQWKV